MGQRLYVQPLLSWGSQLSRQGRTEVNRQFYKGIRAATQDMREREGQRKGEAQG